MRYLPFLLLALVASCNSKDGPDPAPTTKPAPVTLEADDYTITGPYTHENLAVYLFHTTKEVDDEQFITLDEGLKNKWVEVTEKKNEQVSELVIENKHDLPLFLQEGDRLSGGKQDRIAGVCMVIPPNSGKRPLPSFCVESGRWSRGALGGQFVATGNNSFALNSTRSNAKILGSQSGVWKEVAKDKAALAQLAETPNSNTSLNEALDSRKILEISAACKEKLANLLDPHKDVIGLAFALGGRIEEVTLYPSPSLVPKLYPRFLESYAIQASIQKGRDTSKKAPTVSDIRSFMKAGNRGIQTVRDIDGCGNVLHKSLDVNAYLETQYEGRAINHQWFNAPEMPAEPKERQLEQRR